MFAETEILAHLAQTKNAQRSLRALSSSVKNSVLSQLADHLITEQAAILRANELDLKALESQTSAAFRDRLKLDPARISSMVESLKQVIASPDPVGQVEETKTLSNGLHVRRERAPLGTIFMIFESRPNVAIEAFSLGFKSGNAMILRAGKESVHTTSALYQVVAKALQAARVDPYVLWGVKNLDRDLALFLMQQTQWIDVVVPRGGDSLISFVVSNSKIPIIKNDRGMCHIYVHEDADLAMAQAIIVNAKTQRPGVCNAVETILIHQKVAAQFLPVLHEKMAQVEWNGCAETLKILKGKSRVNAAQEASWDTEYLDLKINCRVVADADIAKAHIHAHSSGHSEAVITRSPAVAKAFESEIDAAAVYWNASTRFTDGFELGLGGEIGISTQKLHARGPVGLKELTSLRWIIEGTGQTRS